MKYIKASFIIIIIIIILYNKFNKDSDIVFEDKLSMFVLVKSNNNIHDVLLDLSSQIESFDNYIHNVYYSRDNKFLIKNKLKSQFDAEHIDYRYLLTSSNIIDFNIKVSEIIEKYFLDHNASLHLTKQYLLRDFLVRFYHYFTYQIDLFNKEKSSFELESPLEEFILGPKYVADPKKEYYMMRIEFSSLESMAQYHEAGMDSILNSILEYNSNVFGSEVFLHNPFKQKDLQSPFDFGLKQYVNEFEILDEAINYHRDLMLSDNIFLIESIYDYYFENINNLSENKTLSALSLSPSILDSNYQINNIDYRNSLLILEEKLIALQSDDLSDDEVISNILNDLIGDGYKKGAYSKYIDLINLESSYLVDNLNRLFSYELQRLFNEVDQADREFDILSIPSEVRKHLFPNNKFKVRYFVE